MEEDIKEKKVGDVECWCSLSQVFNQDGAVQRQGQRKGLNEKKLEGDPSPSSGLGFNKDI